MTDPFAGVQPRLPRPEGLNADFYAHAATGRLHLQRCSDCGRFQHPPRYLCRVCLSTTLAWVPVDGIGTLYSWTTTYFPFDRGWAPGLPYSTGVIELPEGVRLVAALPDDVPPSLALPVQVALSPQGEGSALLYLAAAPAARSEEEPWT